MTKKTEKEGSAVSGIRDNYRRGAAADFLRAKIVPDSRLSVVSAYSALLQKAVDSIVATFRRRVAAGLQSGRDFVIPDKKDQANDNTDFELITWMVIR